MQFENAKVVDRRNGHVETTNHSKDMSIPIVFLTKLYDETVYEVLLEVIDHLREDPRVQYHMTSQQQIDAVNKRFPEIECKKYNNADIELEKSIRYLISIGGDGTVLYGCKLFQHGTTPKIIAIEKGTLGFMCRFRIEQLAHTVDVLLKSSTGDIQNLQVERKMRLRCQNKSKTGSFVYHCLNEVAITKASCETPIRLEIYIEGEQFTITSGDGLLISTPTGSTAYALSAGGPIIHNSIRTILIQPISPNSLSFRSICVPSNVCIRLKYNRLLCQLCPRSKTNGFISYDGQVSQQLGLGDQMIVTESSFDVQLLSAQKSSQLSGWSHKLKSLLKFNKEFKSALSFQTSEDTIGGKSQ